MTSRHVPKPRAIISLKCPDTSVLVPTRVTWTSVLIPTRVTRLLRLSLLRSTQKQSFSLPYITTIKWQCLGSISLCTLRSIGEILFTQTTLCWQKNYWSFINDGCFTTTAPRNGCAQKVREPFLLSCSLHAGTWLGSEGFQRVLDHRSPRSGDISHGSIWCGLWGGESSPSNK
jgi:hypothetical protein